MTSRSKGAKSAPQAATASTSAQRSMAVVDAAFDCAAAVLNSSLAILTVEVPPAAAGFAYSGVTSAISCTTKLSLIAANATGEQYKQAACAMEMLNPTGLAIGIIGIGLGEDLCSEAAWGNTTSDAAGLLAEASNPDYVLGNLSRGKNSLVALGTVTVGKIVWNAAGSLADDTTAAGGSDDGVSTDATPAKPEGFVPRGGPGQHPEP